MALAAFAHRGRAHVLAVGVSRLMLATIAGCHWVGASVALVALL